MSLIIDPLIWMWNVKHRKRKEDFKQIHLLVNVIIKAEWIEAQEFQFFFMILDIKHFIYLLL